MNNNWSPFEHSIWKNFKLYEIDQKEQFVLAISGGLDSMVLLEVILKLKPNSKIKVVHFHHGASDDLSQFKFREDSVDLIKKKFLKIQNKRNITFHLMKSESRLISEDQMREARWNFIRSVCDENDVIVTAHHLNDHLETLLLKMIRGTSIDGFLSFKMWNGEVFRPFLQTQKSELLSFAEENEINWKEDPSNSDASYLRNWVREKWLKDLDLRQEGAVKNLALSLFKLRNQLSDGGDFELVFEPNSVKTHLSRTWYMTLSKADQLRSLALFLKNHQIYSYTAGQLEEIRKRLDKNQKSITFEILGRKWVINASQIMIE